MREINGVTHVTQGEARRLLGIARPQRLPARVAYTLGGGVAPDVASRPDMLPPILADLHEDGLAGTAPKRVNGLTYKADCMARWIAHGSSVSDAFRAAYKPPKAMGYNVITQRAWRVTNRPAFVAAVSEYRALMEQESRQTSFKIADYVKSRLVLESQDAKQDAARIQALKLLGQTEGMFTTVHKTERSVNPAELQALKAKLEQRLRETLARLGHGSVPSQGTEGSPEEDGTGGTGPHAPGDPLAVRLVPSMKIYTNPDIRSLENPGGGGTSSPMPDDAGVPSLETQGGGSHLENPADGYLSEFDGPAVYVGALKD